MDNCLNLVVPTFWHKSINYGDQLTPYLIEKISGNKAVLTEQTKDIVTVMVTGSILGTNVFNSIIWGNGYAWYHEAVNKPLDIRAVRGVLSRNKILAFGFDCPEVFGDPALLLPDIYNPTKEVKYKLGIIPHIIDYEKVCVMYDNLENDVIIIDLRESVEEVINKIIQCDKIISSSLHGLITPHAYGIDSMWVEFSDNVIGDGFKFKDYFSSVKIEEYQPLNLRGFLPISKIIEQIPNHKIDFNKDLLYNSCPFLNL